MPDSGRGGVFDVEIIDQRPGIIVFRVSGADELFAGESGGHRWQRVPPNEKHDRVQTSTVTVAVLAEPTAAQVRIDDRDLDWKACRGSGPGGQNRNKTETAIQLTYKPTGLMVRCESERSQKQNLEIAKALLRARIWQAERERIAGARAADRRQQVGSGMRGDKRRTVRCQDGQVNDHVTGRTWRLKEYLRGEW